MGVRAHAAPPPARRPRSVGPGPGATLLVVLATFALLVANGRPVGTTEAAGLAGALFRGATGLASLAFTLDAAGEALVGKVLAALFAALAAGFLFSAVARRHGLGEGRWAGFLLALGTTLAAAAQAWSGEAAATCAVAWAVLLLVAAEEGDEPGKAALAGLPLGLAVALQPSVAALALVLVGAVLVRWRRAGLLALAWAAPGLVLAALFSVSRPHAAGAGPLALLASPAKGVLVFAPVLLVGLVGLLRALRRPKHRLWDQAAPGVFLPVACGLAFFAHLAAVAVAGAWSAPEFWGPRWVAPAAPLVLLFLPEGFALLGVLASVLALVSVGVQALGALTYDGRWDRLHRSASGDLAAATWDVARSPIAFQARERTLRVAVPGLEGGRLVARPRVLAPSGASGSFVSFARTPATPTGVERTISGLRLEAGARVDGGRLELREPGDGLVFRVPEVAAARTLELRVVGRGSGTLGLGVGEPGREPRWRERAVSGAFRFALPHARASSGGTEVRLVLRGGGPLGLDSIALVPPGEPENVLRLP
jgi:hypothetical protein